MIEPEIHMSEVTNANQFGEKTIFDGQLMCCIPTNANNSCAVNDITFIKNNIVAFEKYVCITFCSQCSHKHHFSKKM